MVTPARVGALLAALAGIIALTPVTAQAAPPPPPPPIPAVREPVDGYDLKVPWMLWNSWVDDRRGPVIDALLEMPEAADGEETLGPPVLSFAKANFNGHFATGDIRVYCRREPSDWENRRGCHYRLRLARIPHQTWDYSAPANPVASWTRDNFDAPALARSLRSVGIGPEADFRQLDRARLFSSLPPPDAMLRANAEIEVVDSRDCRAMRRAFEALDRRTLSLRLDMYGVGRDRRWRPQEYSEPALVSYTLRVQAADGAYVWTEITGAGFALERLVEPILAAGRACAKGTGQAGGQ